MHRVTITVPVLAWFLGMCGLLALPSATVAEEGESRARRLLQAHKSSDRKALKRLAEEIGPAGFEFVESVLDLPDSNPAARAFAEVWTDPDRDALVRYVKRRKGKRHAPEALRAYDEALSELRTGRPGAALTLLEGVAFEEGTVSAIETLGARYEALRCREEAAQGTALLLEGAAVAERIGWRKEAARLLKFAAEQFAAERDYSGAREAWERRYRLLGSRGEDADAAACLGNLASSCAQQQDFPAARRHYEAAVEALVAVGDPRNAALARANLGLLHLELGEFERALTHTERALADLRRVGTAPDRAETMALLGTVHQHLGQLEQALSHNEEAVRVMRAYAAETKSPTPNDLFALAIAVGNCGNAYMVLERYEEAHKLLLEALDIFGKQLQDPFTVAVAMANLSELAFRRGDFVGALARVRGAVAQFDKLGAETEATSQRVAQGRILAVLGKHAEALSLFARARETGDRLWLYSVVVNAMTEAAELLLAQGRVKEARWQAFGAVDVLGGSLAHLADGEGADARAHRLRTYQLPIRVALASGDAQDCAEALDEARAGTFLEAFGGRTALREVALPRDLNERLRAAEAAERAAWSELQRARRRRSQPRRAQASRQLAGARKRTGAIHEALQRTAKHAADLVYPRADPLVDVQAELEPGDALILYGLLPTRSVALVVTRDDARIRPLPSGAKIRAAYDALFSSPETEVDPAKAPALAKQIIAPLGLTKKTRRLLISPDGVLTYVPFSLLVPDYVIAYVPSGTTYRTLRSANTPRGKGIIAFGDPAYEKQKNARRIALYGGSVDAKLTRLAASGDEARAIGSTVFVREEATEANLREALKPARRGERFRALHLAGHGIANAENPQLSCIALAPSGQDDGFLLAREVLAMEVPADLVVLSACESVRGKVVRGEGLQGLMRAFMFAGAPRVLASLWKVDDKSTRAFMEKFYELWNPPSGKAQGKAYSAAEALHRTQEYMRTETEWKNPDHWAAWVLWGLPD